LTCSRGTLASHLDNADVELGFRLTVTIDRLDSSDFPSGHESTGFDGALNSFDEELYIKNNAILGVKGFDLHGYTGSVWINQRNFVIRPATDWSGSMPWDAKQTVLFSQLGKPDIFHKNIDYIDVSTPEGDACTGLAELWGNLIVLKELNMFKIRFNNSGNSLNWEIDEHFQKVGMIAPNSLAVGGGYIFFAGKEHIYMFDGNNAIPITKDRIQDEYQSELALSFGWASDYDEIHGMYDPNTNTYRLLFYDDDYSEARMFVYNIIGGYWTKHKYDDTSNVMIPRSLVLGVDYDMLGNTDTKIIKLDSSESASVEDVACEYESQWFSLNDNPFQEKRINTIKLLSINDTSITFRLYKNYGTNATYSKTVTANATRDISWEEVSTTGYVFKLEILNTALEGNEDLQVFELEIDYDELDER